MTALSGAPTGSYAWGMSIDLTTCIGCNACVDRLPGGEQHPRRRQATRCARGREMHWIRVDRYYDGRAWTNPDTLFQPVPCMHCENAPCEIVCPVAATVAQRRGPQRDGLQPLRRHALLLEQLPVQGAALQLLPLLGLRRPSSTKLVRNPDVTVRSRGVMEKCTYCVQRISAARIDGREGGPRHPGRRDRDGLPAGLPGAGDRVRRHQRPGERGSRRPRPSRATTPC